MMTVGKELTKAVLDKVAEIDQDGIHKMSSRGAILEGHNSKVCISKFYRDPEYSETDVFVISAYRNRSGEIIVRVEGPYDDTNDEYWLSMAEYDKDRKNVAIITPDWVHRTVSKGELNYEFAGHGGSEFRFKILGSNADTKALLYRGQGLTVEIEQDPMKLGELHRWEYILVTRNCWYQGKIPKKHRHLFAINAEMVKGSDPGVNR
jgi:hypothetical protein